MQYLNGCGCVPWLEDCKHSAALQGVTSTKSMNLSRSGVRELNTTVFTDNRLIRYLQCSRISFLRSLDHMRQVCYCLIFVLSV